MKNSRHTLLALVLGILPFSLSAQHLPIALDDIVILYDNDVHGAVEGYPLMAQLRSEVEQLNAWPIVVSCGDFLSGTPLGTASDGRYIVRMMNAVGYDYVTLGNHEFDYGIPTLSNRLNELKSQVLCSNFRYLDGSIRTGAASHLVRYGSTWLGFLGITTPQVATTSTPKLFQDSDGNWLYDFHANDLAQILQVGIDSLRQEGADLVILIAHIGETDMPSLIAATQGLDIVLDGHSHSVIPHTLLYDRANRPVLWTSTGSYFKHVGELVIGSETIRSTLIPRDTLAAHPQSEASLRVADTLAEVLRQYAEIGSRPVGFSEQPLPRINSCDTVFDSPLGNFFTDAFRYVSGAPIAITNAGGIRVSLPSGGLTYNDLYTSSPFKNQLAIVEMSGQTLLDALEMGCRKCPKISGGFLHVSGLRFEVDTTIPSPVVLDEHFIFDSIAGPRRVSNVQVWDDWQQSYLPLDPDQIYRVAGSDYSLLNNGDGHRFRGIRVIDPSVCFLTDALERYLHDVLQGHIDTRYARPEGRIRPRSH